MIECLIAVISNGVTGLVIAGVVLITGGTTISCCFVGGFDAFSPGEQPTCWDTDGDKGTIV